MNLGASVFSLLCAATHSERSTLVHHPKNAFLQTAAKVPELKVFPDRVPSDRPGNKRHAYDEFRQPETRSTSEEGS